MQKGEINHFFIKKRTLTKKNRLSFALESTFNHLLLFKKQILNSDSVSSTIKIQMFSQNIPNRGGVYFAKNNT